MKLDNVELDELRIRSGLRFTKKRLRLYNRKFCTRFAIELRLILIVLSKSMVNHVQNLRLIVVFFCENGAQIGTNPSDHVPGIWLDSTHSFFFTLQLQLNFSITCIMNT